MKILEYREFMNQDLDVLIDHVLFHTNSLALVQANNELYLIKFSKEN